MLQRVRLEGIELPRLYIAENKEDVMKAKTSGIPYIKWTRGQDELIRILLRPALEKMFPHIKWNKVLGRRNRFKTVVVQDEINEMMSPEKSQIELAGRLDVNPAQPKETEPTLSEPGEPVDEVDAMPERFDDDGDMYEVSSGTYGERLFDSTDEALPMIIEHRTDLETYVGDVSSQVNLDVLQRLRLMPAFIGDILDCVRLNVGNGMYWSEGYNKRLGLPVGRYNASGQLPNLIILDVSGSIPRGISATMISLVDTLRSQLTADLIITSDHSRFYAMGEELPDPQRIRDMFGYGNEAHDFFEILDTKVRGRHYGHVISFGDNDTPTYYGTFHGTLAGTIVEHVHHYHTGIWADDETETGYAKWCHMLARKPIADYDTSWCEVIKD